VSAVRRASEGADGSLPLLMPETTDVVVLEACALSAAAVSFVGKGGYSRTAQGSFRTGQKRAHRGLTTTVQRMPPPTSELGRPAPHAPRSPFTLPTPQHKYTSRKRSKLAAVLGAQSAILVSWSTIEAALPNLDAAPWWTLFAPKGTPRPILDKLTDALKRRGTLGATFAWVPSAPAGSMLLRSFSGGHRGDFHVDNFCIWQRVLRRCPLRRARLGASLRR